MSYHLVDLMQSLGRPRILVLGDLILDRYTWGNAERISQEAPVILLREEKQEVRLGGAANVANLLRGLDVDVTVAGVVGADADGRILRQELERHGADCTGVVADPSRPTTVKQRYLGHAQHRHPHQMIRVDREVRTPLAGGFAKELLDAVLSCLDDYQAVIISDYAKGVCTPEIVQQVVKKAKEVGIPVIVDPPASGSWNLYNGVTAMTPNRTETQRAVGRPVESVEEAFAAGRLLCAQHDMDHVFVTLDSDGIALVKADGNCEMLPTRRREVCDITGAGDMVIAMIGVGAAAGVPPTDLARLANTAGGLEVEQIGVVCVSREEIISDLLTGSRTLEDKVCPLEEAAQHVSARKRLGQRIILTNGCFDVLHVGHVTYLEQAAREGDCLVVALNSDDSIRELEKAPGRPIFDQDYRAAMLASLESVDYVVVFDESTPHNVIEQLKPNLLVKGGTYAADEIVGWELVESYGGQVKPMGEVPGVSTTALLQRFRDSETPATIPHPAKSAGAPERKAG